MEEKTEQAIKVKEDQGLILGYNEHKNKAKIAHIIGTKRFNLIEVELNEDSEVKVQDKLDISNSSTKVKRVISKISYNDLSKNEQKEVEKAVHSIIITYEKRYVDFFNEQTSEGTKLHFLEGISRKVGLRIIETKREVEKEEIKNKIHNTFIEYEKKLINYFNNPDSNETKTEMLEEIKKSIILKINETKTEISEQNIDKTEHSIKTNLKKQINSIFEETDSPYKDIENLEWISYEYGSKIIKTKKEAETEAIHKTVTNFIRENISTIIKFINTENPEENELKIIEDLSKELGLEIIETKKEAGMKEIEKATYNMVINNEKRFLDFYYEQRLDKKKTIHLFEELTKQLGSDILEGRKEAEYTSFEDISKRVRAFKDPELEIAKRVLKELTKIPYNKKETQIYLFTSPKKGKKRKKPQRVDKFQDDDSFFLEKLKKEGIIPK